jgi:hypothetical protein
MTAMPLLGLLQTGQRRRGNAPDPQNQVRHRLESGLTGGGEEALGSSTTRLRAAGRRDGRAGRGGFPHEINLCCGQGVGMVDEVAEGALQRQGFGSDGSGGFEAAGVFVAQRVDSGGG